MTPRRKRVVLIAGVVAAVAVATGLVLNAFRSNLVFFYSPSQVAANEAPAGRTFRLGGLVERGSLERQGLSVRFLVTDTAQTIAVRYEGILPDLFKEGKGVVAQGRIGSDGVFVAQEVLAKHDENYMPPEAAAALERARAGGTTHDRAAHDGAMRDRAMRDRAMRDRAMRDGMTHDGVRYEGAHEVDAGAAKNVADAARREALAGTAPR